MNNLNDYFDRIYCVNLKRRVERWNRVQKQFIKNNIKVRKYEAVDGNTIELINGLRPGELGCLLSHLNILKECQRDGVEKVLITEDDVEFCDDLTSKFFDYIEEVPEWDMLYFGANHALCNSYEKNPPIKISQHVYKVLHAYSTHAYAVNKSCYQYLIDYISKITNPLDVMYSMVQKDMKVYLFRPHLAWQSEGYSDIMEKNVDYAFLKNFQMKKLSIAIPTWECGGRGVEFLDDLLRTIEIQTFKDFEVVISDHSQNDDLIHKIQEFDSKIDINYFRNENDRGNSPANLNNAINKCSGEIIKIMFQDDFFYDDEALEKIYHALNDSDRMWLLNGTNHTKDHGHSFYWDLYPTFNENLLKGVNTISSPSVVAFKKEADIRFDTNLIHLMDIDYYYAMKEKYGDPVYCNDILVSNRLHDNSITNNIENLNEMRLRESDYCLQKYGVKK